MYAMKNLYLEISENLKKTVPEYKEALECGCIFCLKITAVYLKIEEAKQAGNFHNLKEVKEILPCELCGKAVATTGRLFKYDNGTSETVPVCGVCAIRHEASK